jgi:hypothetical protein
MHVLISRQASVHDREREEGGREREKEGGREREGGKRVHTHTHTHAHTHTITYVGVNELRICLFVYERM